MRNAVDLHGNYARSQLRYTILSEEKVLVLDLSDKFYNLTSWYEHYSSWLEIMWRVMQPFMRSQSTKGMSNRETLEADNNTVVSHSSRIVPISVLKSHVAKLQ